MRHFDRDVASLVGAKAAGIYGSLEKAVRLMTRQQVRQEIASTIKSNLAQLAGVPVVGDGLEALTGITTAAAPATAVESAVTSPPDDSYMAPWIDTPQCTTCDECTNLNPKIFVYNSEKKAFIKDPHGGRAGTG